MNIRLKLLMLTAAGVVGCSGSSTGPTAGGGGAPGTVTVGDIFFSSGHNGTRNPAVDTVTAGSTVTWTWTNTGSTSHSVLSEASPTFASSATMSGNGTTYSLTFTTPGTYQYDCAVHRGQMTGTIVVQ